MLLAPRVLPVKTELREIQALLAQEVLREIQDLLDLRALPVLRATRDRLAQADAVGDLNGGTQTFQSATHLDIITTAPITVKTIDRIEIGSGAQQVYAGQVPAQGIEPCLGFEALEDQSHGNKVAVVVAKVL